MELQNDTTLPTEVIREHVDDRWGIVVAINKATYEVTDGGLVLSKNQVPVWRDPAADAPAGEVHHVQESGLVDITCVGDICAPGGQPTPVMDVNLRWRDSVRLIRVFGRRVWRRSGGRLAPTDPEPFSVLPMSWSGSFGGVHAVPPGFAPHSRLPMPSGEVAFAPNRNGIGFYLDEADADGKVLPNLEDPGNLIRAHSDRPTPVCFAPCPLDSGLRMAHLWPEGSESPHPPGHGDREAFPRMLRNAPPSLQARDVGPGTVFTLEGMTPVGPFVFAVPAVSFLWEARVGAWSRRFRPELVGVQIRPTERRISLQLRTSIVYPMIREQQRHARLFATGVAALGSAAVA